MYIFSNSRLKQMGDEERKKMKKKVRFTTIYLLLFLRRFFFLLLLSLNYLLLFVKTVTRSKLLSTFWLMTLSEEERGSVALWDSICEILSNDGYYFIIIVFY